MVFSRQKTTDKILMNTVSFIHHSMEFIKTILPTTIRIQEEYQADELIINANEDQINQLIVNLCSNAGDFIKDNVGMLTIKVEKINKKNQLDSFPGIQLANHMKLSISDTGSGINPEKIDRIFDPFYTTKEIGKGSGLGLSIVHNIVKNHNGHIFVESTLGEGTTFSIFIPLAEGSQG